MPSARPDLLKAARWLADHRSECRYSEGSDRESCVKVPYAYPFVSDCSAGVTAIYYWGNAPDPNAMNFEGDFYTGTLVAHGTLVAAKNVRDGDVVIFGPDTGWHAAFVMSGGSDPIVWSMGEQGDPRFYRVSTVEQAVAYVNHVTSCEVRYFRYSTTKVRGLGKVATVAQKVTRRLRLPFLG